MEIAREMEREVREGCFLCSLFFFLFFFIIFIYLMAIGIQ